MEKKDVRAHGQCAKKAKTVAAHAKCVAELLDTPPGKNDVPILKKTTSGLRKGLFLPYFKSFCFRKTEAEIIRKEPETKVCGADNKETRFHEILQNEILQVSVDGKIEEDTVLWWKEIVQVEILGEEDEGLPEGQDHEEGRLQ